jgi:hypothetical protein
MVKVQEFLQNLLLSFFSIMRWLFLAKRPHKCEVAKKAVILGNGPSAKEYLNSWKRKGKTDYWAVNFFAQTEVYSNVKPEHYIMVDPILWSKNVAEKTFHRRAKLYLEMNQKTDWSMILWVPNNAVKIIKNEFISNTKIIVKGFNENAVEGFYWLKNAFITNGAGVPRPRNILIPAIAKCIHLSYEKIVLIGTDHDWLKDVEVDEENKIWITDRHFYDKNILEKDKYRIRIKKGANEFLDFSELMYNYYHVFTGYKLLAKIANSRNVDIFNTTKHSFIDSFRKV